MRPARCADESPSGHRLAVGVPPLAVQRAPHPAHAVPLPGALCVLLRGSSFFISWCALIFANRPILFSEEQSGHDTLTAQFFPTPPPGVPDLLLAAHPSPCRACRLRRGPRHFAPHPPRPARRPPCPGLDPCASL